VEKPSKRKIVLVITYGFVAGFIIAGVITMAGIMTESRVQLFAHEFNWEGNEGRLILRFESSNGIFVAGEKIQVNSFLQYPVSSDPAELYLLYFPNTLEQENYDQLISDDFWEIEVDDEGVTIGSPYNQKLVNIGGVPPLTEFDVIWTQEGVQEGILLMDSSAVTIGGAGIKYSDEIVLEKMITIQPSEVNLQRISNNYSVGLVSVIIGITILTAYFGVEKIWFLNHDSKRS